MMMTVGEMHGMALCSGIGGIELGLASVMPSYRTVVHVEREAFCASILAARMEDGYLDPAPIWTDVATFDGRPWRSIVDIITAGYPCQPFSCAGQRKGADDPRHIWPHVARIIGECTPSCVFLENVPGHITLGLEQVCADLHTMGYDISAGVFSANECGAPHLRKRLFILAADPQRISLQQSGRIALASGQGAAQPEFHGSTKPVADTNGTRLRGGESETRGAVWNKARRQKSQRRSVVVPGNEWWSVEPSVGRLADGIPHRVDRLRALGNAVVPQAAAKAFMHLAGWAA